MQGSDISNLEACNEVLDILRGSIGMQILAVAGCIMDGKSWRVCLLDAKVLHRACVNKHLPFHYMLYKT